MPVAGWLALLLTEETHSRNRTIGLKIYIRVSIRFISPKFVLVYVLSRHSLHDCTDTKIIAHRLWAI